MKPLDKLEAYQNKEKMFIEISNILNHYGYIEPQDIFRVINDFQNSKLNDIEKANTNEHKQALFRTLLYTNDYLIKAYTKSTSVKNKKSILFKIVNNFVIQVPEYKYKDHCVEYTDMFNIIIEPQNIESILKSEDWYLRTIPESKWLIDMMKNGELK